MTAALVVLGEDALAGAGASAAEAGVAEDAIGAEIPSSAHDLGDGHKMQFSDEQFRRLLHSPEVVEAIRQRAQGVCNDCNQHKVKKNAVYEVLIQNEEWTTRARAFVRPGNADAFYDDARYSTMLKAAANAPNDPRLTPDPGEGDATGSGAPEEGAAAGEAAGAAEGAEAAEVAELAVIAL